MKRLDHILSTLSQGGIPIATHDKKNSITLPHFSAIGSVLLSPILASMFLAGFLVLFLFKVFLVLFSFTGGLQKTVSFSQAHTKSRDVGLDTSHFWGRPPEGRDAFPKGPKSVQ